MCLLGSLFANIGALQEKRPNEMGVHILFTGGHLLRSFPKSVEARKAPSLQAGGPKNPIVYF